MKELLKSMDVDGSGEVDYEEFLAATLAVNKLKNESNLERAFAYFDKDDSGFITVDELMSVVKEFKLGDQMDVNQMLSDADRDDDGKIDYGRVPRHDEGQGELLGQAVLMARREPETGNLRGREYMIGVL